MINNYAPYVVTDDLEIVFPYLRRQVIIPPDLNVVKSASEKIRRALNMVFPRVDVVDASRISGYLNGRISLISIPTISLTGLLDNKLTTADLHFSRSVRRVSNDLSGSGYQSIGVMPRTRQDLSYTEQFDLAANLIGSSSNRIVLVDDVVFSGGTILTIAREFSKRSISIEKVIVSVAIESAIPKLVAEGINIDADIVYNDVHDEVCMRDFIIGAPEGGRNVISLDGYYEAAPYINPFGEIENWASIPQDRSEEFSRIATEASLDIWRDVDRRNKRPILVGDLAKPIISLNVSESIVAQLERKLGC